MPQTTLNHFIFTYIKHTYPTLYLGLLTLSFCSLAIAKPHKKFKATFGVYCPNLDALILSHHFSFIQKIKGSINVILGLEQLLLGPPNLRPT